MQIQSNQSNERKIHLTSVSGDAKLTIDFPKHQAIVIVYLTPDEARYIITELSRIIVD